MLRKGPTSLLEVGPFVYSLMLCPWDRAFLNAGIQGNRSCQNLARDV